ncbi:MAG: HXXEE domain-containing protein [Pseudomonadota bacterium]
MVKAVVFVLAFAMLWLPLGQHDFLLLHWMKIGTFMVPFLVLVALSFNETRAARSPQFIALIMFAAYIGHQFEEHWIDLYGRNYAFQGAVNALIVGALGIEAEPGNLPDILTRVSVFVINTSLVWLVAALAIWRGATFVFPVLAMVAIAFVNGISHVVSSVIAGAYNPGLVTSVALFLPLSVWAYRALLHDGLASKAQVWWSITWAIAGHIIMIFGLIAANWWMLFPEYIYFGLLVAWSAVPTVAAWMVHQKGAPYA